MEHLIKCPSFKWITTYGKVFNLTYMVNAEKFVQKYKDKFVFLIPLTNPNEGVAGFVYQMSPDLFLFGRLYTWIEHEKLNSYMVCQIYFHNLEDYMKFYDDNIELRLSGNTEERTGFNPNSNAGLPFGGMK